MFLSEEHRRAYELAEKCNSFEEFFELLKKDFPAVSEKKARDYFFDYFISTAPTVPR